MEDTFQIGTVRLWAGRPWGLWACMPDGLRSGQVQVPGRMLLVNRNGRQEMKRRTSEGRELIGRPCLMSPSKMCLLACEADGGLC
jgi:hypothetical protein